MSYFRWFCVLWWTTGVSNRRRCRCLITSSEWRCSLASALAPRSLTERPDYLDSTRQRATVNAERCGNKSLQMFVSYVMVMGLTEYLKLSRTSTEDHTDLQTCTQHWVSVLIHLVFRLVWYRYQIHACVAPLVDMVKPSSSHNLVQLVHMHQLMMAIQLQHFWKSVPESACKLSHQEKRSEVFILPLVWPLLWPFPQKHHKWQRTQTPPHGLLIKP